MKVLITIIAICFTLPWQIVLFLTGITIVIKRFDLFFYLLIVLIILSAGLYFFWFRNLSMLSGLNQTNFVSWYIIQFSQQLCQKFFRIEIFLLRRAFD